MTTVQSLYNVVQGVGDRGRRIPSKTRALLPHGASVPSIRCPTLAVVPDTSVSIGDGGNAGNSWSDVDSGSTVDAASSFDAGPGCVAKSCAELGAQCGTLSDGCGQIVDCGQCPTGETCSAAVKNLCGPGACVPTTCAAQGTECGSMPDGCGGTLDCGGCQSNEYCNDGECECDAETCSSLGWSCGGGSDGCGGTLSCGKCGSNTTCVSHSCQPAAGSICGWSAICPPGFSSKTTISCGPTTDCPSSTQKICIRDGMSYDVDCGASCPAGMHSALGVLYNCNCPGGAFVVCVPD